MSLIMRSISLFVTLAGVLPLFGQIAPAPPQTARQALIEMFVGKGPDDFAKHLPDSARRALIRKGEATENSFVLRISSVLREANGQGGHIETFDNGPVILTLEQEEHKKFEVTVDRDSFTGDEDEIEVSVHGYQNGKELWMPILPSLVFHLKQEKEVWQLTDVAVTARVPLVDPDYLHGVRKELDHSIEAAVQMRISLMSAAETRVAARHPERGYSCSLSTLFSPDSAAQSDVSYDPGQGNEEWNGYRFALSGCDGPPASKYRISAVPVEAESELSIFCVDESGAIKVLDSGKASSCFSEGKPVGGDQPSIVD